MNGTLSILRADLVLAGSRTYDGSTVMPGSTLTAFGVNGETFSVQGGGDPANLASPNVVTGAPLASVAGLSLSSTGNGGLSSNYNAISTVGSSVDITPAPLTVSTTAVTKTYDGTTSATGSATVTGGTLFGGDTLAGGSYAFTDPNAGTGKTVTVSGVTVQDGNSGGNYTVTYVDNTTSTIDPARLLVTGTRVYDGTTLMPGSTLVASGVAGQTFTVTGAGASGNLTTKNVQTNQLLASFGGLALGTSGNGGLAGNYLALPASDSSVSVTPAPLALSSADITKSYDSTTSAAGTPAVAGGTLFGGDTLAGGSYAFTDPNAGTGKTVTAGGITVQDGNGGGNYTVTYVDNTTSTITPAPLTVSTSDVTKTYDGTTSASGTPTVTGGTLFGGDTLTGGSYAFTDPNAGTGKTVTVGGVTVQDGNSGGNYTVTYADSSTGSIDTARLVLSGTRVYDGSTVMPGSTLVASGVAGQTFTVTGPGASGNLTTKDVQTNQLMASVDGLALGTSGNGGLAGNYLPLSTVDSSVSITPQPLNIAVVGVDKPFDGNTAATVTPTGDDRVPGDQLTVTPVAPRFDDALVGVDKPIQVGPVNLGGPDGGNYVAVLPSGPVTADITQAQVPAPLIPPVVPPAAPPVAPPPTVEVVVVPAAVEPPPAPLAPAALAPSTPPRILTPRLGEPQQVNTCAERGSGQLAGFVSVRRLEPLQVPLGTPFAFAVPATTCVPCDPNATLVYEARMPNGRDPLPSWLRFTPATREFTGTAPAGLQRLEVIVIVRDRFGVEATVPVTLVAR